MLAGQRWLKVSADVDLTVETTTVAAAMAHLVADRIPAGVPLRAGGLGRQLDDDAVHRRRLSTRVVGSVQPPDLIVAPLGVVVALSARGRLDRLDAAVSEHAAMQAVRQDLIIEALAGPSASRTRS